MTADSDGSSLGVQILIIVLLTALNAFFSAAEIAFVSINQGKMAQKAQEGDKRAIKVMRLLENSDEFLATIQVAITFAGFFSSASAATSFSSRIQPLLGNIPGAETLALIIVTVVLAYLTLVFGELYPKQVALQVAEQIALYTAGPILFVKKISKPFVWILTFSTGLLKRMTPIEFTKVEEKLTRSEMKSLLANSRNDGAIDISEFAMMQGVLSLDTKLAREVMVPRTDTLMLDVDDELAENLEIILNCSYSRLPLYEEDKDTVIGVVHVKDVFRAAREQGFDNIDLRALAHEPVFVPSTIFVDDLLVEFRKTRQHLAVLKDEYGGVEGIVTLEDLIEEIVGDIEDEYDEEEKEVVEIDENNSVIDAGMSLDRFNQIYQTSLESDEVDTMAGAIIEKLGYFPDDDEVVKVRFEGYLLQPTEIENDRIRKIHVTKLSEEELEQIRAEEGETDEIYEDND